MNVDENGSVTKDTAQNMTFIFKRKSEDDKKDGWTILKKHHTNKSSNIASLGFSVFTPVNGLNYCTPLCLYESMWPEHSVRIVLPSKCMRHCSTSWYS